MALVITAVATFLLGLPLTFLLHEAGHGIAAKIVGATVVRFQIGVGQPLKSAFVFGVEWVIADRLTGARTVIAPLSNTGWRWRRFAVAVGGPIFSALVGVLSLGFALSTLLGSGVLTPVALAAGIFGGLNLVELVNLVPLEGRPTDGGNARAALLWTPAEELESALGQMFGELDILLRRRHFDKGRRVVQRMATVEDSHFLSIFALGSLELLEGNLDLATRTLGRARDLAVASGCQKSVQRVNGLLQAIAGAAQQATAAGAEPASAN